MAKVLFGMNLRIRFRYKKHIVADGIRYTGKETNNIDETQITGIDADSYLEYENFMEFYDWILSLKPGIVKNKGISQQPLYKIKTKM